MKGECGEPLPAVPWVGLLYHYHPSPGLIYWNLVVAVDDNNISVCTLNWGAMYDVAETTLNDIEPQVWAEALSDRGDELHLVK